MTEPALETVRSDFDRIARLMSQQDERAEPYDSFLLEHIPTPCARLLEVGCGAGRMARQLAARCAEVVGIDASPGMIELARSRSAGVANLHLVCDDFMTHAFGSARFDCIFSVTTLHHLPFAPTIERMKSLLAPGGVLVFHDVRASSGADFVASGLRVAVNGEIVHWLRRRLTEPRELSRAWREHGANERYLRMEEVLSNCEKHLPGARTFNHALFRYTVLWRAAQS